ncbi:U-box domain-containing protein 43 [Rhynchospora pubera]|uniref:RING-type E3 ubiquitin transferase n=1 Tax=Rhynchospora pubera TaxID=906938 RepID=A0AAV8H0B2_9POAL|nr:U-box domain-containing protein 43 [Rhynchospora pubera]
MAEYPEDESSSTSFGYSNQQDNISGLRPPYKAFRCPISREIMQDPVFIESGYTFERGALVKRFEVFTKRGRQQVCPITLKELSSTSIIPNIALRSAIEEWKETNDAIGLEKAVVHLTNDGADSDVLWSMEFIVQFCKKNIYNKTLLRKKGVVTVIADMLRSTNEMVRLRVLEALRILVEENDENKDVLAEGDIVRTIIKFLTQGTFQEKDLAVSLLYELSKANILSERIGCVDGLMIILAGIASDTESNSIAEKADQVLKNLGKCESNIMQLAEVGRIESLFDMLLHGPTLVKMLNEGDNVAQELSLTALCQISSNEESAKMLIEDKILSPVINYLFVVGPNHLASHRMKMKELAAICLSNLVSSGVDFTAIPINDKCNTLVSENTVEDLLHFVSNTGALTTLIQLIEAPRIEIRVASLKLLQNLLGHMDQELAKILCQNSGQLGSLVQVISETSLLTEEHVATIGLLGGLSRSDSSLTTQLAEFGAFEIFASQVARIRQGDISSNRYTSPALEGLVKILTRITFMLQENQKNIQLAISLNLASLFTDLLGINGSDEVLVNSATALANLSTESKNLSKLPQQPAHKPNLINRLSRKQASVVTKPCPVHRGQCSAKDTFCLIECKAMEKLIQCCNKNVVEAALGALCTLLEDGTDSDEAIWQLYELGGIELIFDVLIQDETKALQRRAVWAVERILRIEDMAKQAAGHASVGIALGRAFQLGDSSTPEVARKALEHIKRLPVFSDIYHTTK